MPPNMGQLVCVRTLSIFIVDSKRGCHVDELGSLNIGGSLSIRRLEKVKNLMAVRKANLAGKMDFKILNLFCYRNESATETQDITEHVLEALEPPPSLKHLKIANYKGGHFPHWFKNNATVQNIGCIDFNDCINCLELPTSLRKLPSLTSLILSGMKFVQYVNNECYSNGVQVKGFTSLRHLYISDLPKLERLSKEERREIFPCLTSLTIYRCLKLNLHCL